MPAETLLLVDDDIVFLRVLGRAMEKHGYNVLTASNLTEGAEMMREHTPKFAVVDLHIGEENGFDLVSRTCELSPETKVVVLSGYANVPAAVASVKNGALNCLPKPIESEELHKALRQAAGDKEYLNDSYMDPTEKRLQHILTYWEKNDRNVSQTARELGMHRRSLQRILSEAGVEKDHSPNPIEPTQFQRTRRLHRIWSKLYSTS